VSLLISSPRVTPSSGREYHDLCKSSPRLGFSLRRGRAVVMSTNRERHTHANCHALPVSVSVVGQITPDAASEIGLRAVIPVVADGTDIGSAALGAGVTRAGQAYYSMGTGSNLGIMIPTQQKVEEYRILKWPHVLPGLTMFDAPMAFTGASLKWFGDQFGDVEWNVAERMGQNVFDLFTARRREERPKSSRLWPSASGRSRRS